MLNGRVAGQQTLNDAELDGEVMMRWTCALVLASLLVGCGQQDSVKQQGSHGPEETAQPGAAWPTLALERRDAGKLAVIFRGIEERRPRMAEVRIVWSEGWTFKSYAPGQAALAAEKQVHVQPVSPTEARVLVFSSGNTLGIGDGTLAELELTGSGAGTAQILATPPILAPSEAEVGLHLGDPISL